MNLKSQYISAFISILLFNAYSMNEDEGKQTNRGIFIRPLSDIHLEHKEFKYDFNGEHVIVFAGDINTGDAGLKWAKQLKISDVDIDDTHICYVAGNHEYYGSSIPKTDQLLKSLSDSKVHVLNNSSVKIHGAYFLGATLWTDMKGDTNEVLPDTHIKQQIQDYKQIKKPQSQEFIEPKDTIKLHEESVKWLDKRLGELKGHPRVVISHHAPSKRSIAQRFVNDALSAVFFSKLEGLIEKHQPEIWFHGHTHNKSDYRIGDTRIICNPRGYPEEFGEAGFDAQRIIYLDLQKY